jgi:hypothetical protein
VPFLFAFRWAVAVPVEVVGIGPKNRELPLVDIGAVEVRWRRRYARIRVGRITRRTERSAGT